MIRINLLASDRIKKEERNELVLVAYSLLVIAVVVGGLNYGAKFRDYSKLEERVKQSERELVKYESILKQVEALQATKATLETKKNVISSLMKDRLTYLFFMEDILEVIPANLWFKNIATKAGSEGMMNVDVGAEALDNNAIADFVSALTSDPDFSAVELGAITTSPGEKGATSSFRLKFSYQKKS